MNEDVTGWQMVRIGAIFFVCAYVAVAVIFWYEYPETVHAYLRTWGY